MHIIFIIIYLNKFVSKTAAYYQRLCKELYRVKKYIFIIFITVYKCCCSFRIV
mgnify:CR=1 FL=1